MISLYLVLIVAMLTVFIRLLSSGLGSGLGFSSRAERIGHLGEKEVGEILMQLPDEYYVWNDILIQRNGFSVQIDHVVISPYGIFAIETKNYRGNIYGDDNAGQWKQIIVTPVKYRRSGKTYTYITKNYFYNPVKQNRSHVMALANLFCMSTDNIVSVVVFLESASLKYKGSCTVIHISQLMDVIRRHGTRIRTEEDVRRLAGILDVASMETVDDRKEHLRRIKKNRDHEWHTDNM